MRCRGTDPAEQRAESFARLRRLPAARRAALLPLLPRTLRRARARRRGHPHGDRLRGERAVHQQGRAARALADFVLSPQFAGPRADHASRRSTRPASRAYRRIAPRATPISPATSSRHGCETTQSGANSCGLAADPDHPHRRHHGPRRHSCYTLSDLHGPLRRAGLFHHNMASLDAGAAFHVAAARRASTSASTATSWSRC